MEATQTQWIHERVSRNVLLMRWLGEGRSDEPHKILLVGDAHWDNYVPMEPGSDELKDIKQHNESEDGQLVQVEPGDLQRAPFTVQCGKCSHVFAVGNHYSDLA